MLAVRHENGQQTVDRIWSILNGIPDPEIPIISIVDLGIVRFVRPMEDQLLVGLSPTYSACPATEVIEKHVLEELESNGFNNVRVERVLSPPWTTDWISEAGREKLRNFGITPPERGTSKRGIFGKDFVPACPRCKSQQTEKVSEFGSTPCKAAYKCKDCLEPFDYFKCI